MSRSNPSAFFFVQSIGELSKAKAYCLYFSWPLSFNVYAGVRIKANPTPPVRWFKPTHTHACTKTQAHTQMMCLLTVVSGFQLFYIFNIAFFGIFFWKTCSKIQVQSMSCHGNEHTSTRLYLSLLPAGSTFHYRWNLFCNSIFVKWSQFNLLHVCQLWTLCYDKKINSIHKQ